MARKEIGKGADSFEKLRLQNGYYVDKTDFIQTVFGSAIEVLLLTRPRRFGKTLTMSTFQSFLSINPDNPGDVSKQLKLFEGTPHSQQRWHTRGSCRKKAVRAGLHGQISRDLPDLEVG